jgi:hypothetical protein
MFIEPHAPFRITRDADGAWSAVKNAIQLTVTADVGECSVKHRVGQKPHTKEDSRWLHASLRPTGEVHIFISGTHVLVTGKDCLPTFDLASTEELLGRAAAALKPEKDERGRYVVDTEANRQILRELVGHVTRTEQNRLLAWVRHAASRLADW